MLSIDDRLSIQSLYARYCACFDLGDVQGWIDCWTEDALFRTAKESRGHAQLRVFIEGRIKARPEAAFQNVQHWNSSLIVEGDGKRATGMCYLLLVGKKKDAQEFAILTQGTYLDELAKAGGTWRFSSRRMTPELPQAAAIPR